jgi:hypothetical protein
VKHLRTLQEDFRAVFDDEEVQQFAASYADFWTAAEDKNSLEAAWLGYAESFLPKTPEDIAEMAREEERKAGRIAGEEGLPHNNPFNASNSDTAGGNWHNGWASATRQRESDNREGWIISVAPALGERELLEGEWPRILSLSKKKPSQPPDHSPGRTSLHPDPEPAEGLPRGIGGNVIDEPILRKLVIDYR